MKDKLGVEATVILRGCKQSVKSTVRQQFVILNIVKDLGGQSSITLLATRSGALWADSAQDDRRSNITLFLLSYTHSQDDSRFY